MNIIHNSHSFCRAYFAHNTTSQENRWLKNAILSWFTQIAAQWKHKNMKVVWGRHSTQNRALPGKEQITFLFAFLQLFQLCSEAEAPVTSTALSLFPFGQKTNKSHTQKTKPQARRHLYSCLAKAVRLPKRTWGGEECKVRIAISSLCSNTHNPRGVSGGTSNSPREDPEFN